MNKKTLLFLAISLLLSACGKKKNPTTEAKIPEYAVMNVGEANATLSSTYPATLRGIQDVEIRPRVSGNITAIHIQEGQNVRKGQLLFSIDNSQYKDAVKSSKSAVKACQIQVSTAELTVKNKTLLHAKKIISDFDFETAQNQLAGAKAQLASARAQLSSAKENLSRCSILAPTSGSVGMIPYKVGALVSPQIQQPLTSVSRINPIQAYFSLSEKQVLELSREVGGSLENHLDSLPPVHLILADGTVYNEIGHIDAINSMVDSHTGSIQLRATFNNPQHLLLSGSSANISIEKKYQNVVMIPQKATTEIQNKTFVFILTDSNRVNYTTIDIAPQNDGQNYIVTNGLKKGQKIVCEGVQTLKNNMKIRPITLAQSTEKRKKATQAIKEGKLPF